MKKVEKVLKQKILINSEESLNNYNLEYNWYKKDLSKNKLISKSQYKLASISNSVCISKLKFPLLVSQASSKESINVDKKKKVVLQSKYLESTLFQSDIKNIFF